MSKTNHPTKLWWLIATWFGSGLSPVASGTAGSLAALPFAWLIQTYFGNLALFFASIAIFFIGWWASNEYLRHSSSPIREEAGRGAQSAQSEQGAALTPTLSQGEREKLSDPKEIVVDEVAGQWLVLSLFAPSIGLYIVGFLLFRLFDIIKIWPASWADQKVGGGLGVMLDDIFAALQAIVLLAMILLTAGMIAGGA